MAVFSGNGSLGSPSFTFSSDNTTGFYRAAASQVGLTLGGAQGAVFSPTGLTLTNSGNCSLSLSRTGTNPGTAAVGVLSNGDLQLLASQTGAGNIYLNFSGGQGAVLQNAGTEVLRYTPVTSHLRMAAGTNGIQFNGDTAAANALDDYEEGTWTPVIAGESSAGTGTYTYQAGKYAKVGNLVLASCFVSTSAHTGTGNITVTGLPFAVNGLNYGVAGEVRGHAASSYGGTVIASCFAYNASTTLRFMDATNTVVTMGTGVGTVQIMFTYVV